MAICSIHNIVGCIYFQLILRILHRESQRPPETMGCQTCRLFYTQQCVQTFGF
jgi:hypothetical protein